MTGETTTTIQAYRFPKDKFTAAEAKVWLKANGVTDYSFEEATGAQNKLHDAILQTLDRMVNDTYLTVDSFVASVDKWNGIPLIFAKDHPDQIKLAKDLLKEIERIGGRLVGAVADARVETTGHPRLMAQLDFDDAEADKFWEEGKLSPSTAFSCTLDDKRRTVGPIDPSHVLLFKETPKDQPGDPGTFILNKATVSNSVVPFQDLPLDQERAWNAADATARVAKWAGGPDKDKIDWQKYRKAFLWYDPQSADIYGGYKLPMADVINGELRAVWRGVVAAAAVVSGARGTVDIPSQELETIRHHIARYYDKAGKSVPWTGKAEGFELIDKLKRWAARLISNQERSADGESSEGNGETTMNEKEYEQKLASAAKETDELKNRLASKDAEVGNLQGTIKARDAEIEKLTGEIAEFKKKVADEEWAQEKATLAVGFLKDKEEELRKQFETQTRAYYKRKEALNMRTGTGQEGSEQTGGAGEAKHGVDRWNPAKKEYEVI